MRFIRNDGGRAAEGFKGSAGDCVVRAIAIAAQLPYKTVYDRIQAEVKGERRQRSTGRKSNARTGVFTSRTWFKRYMTELGFTWHPTMKIGTGCQVHLTERELPHGRLVVSLSRHYAAVIDLVLHDTYDHSEERSFIETIDGVTTIKRWYRCVYGYWQFNSSSVIAQQSR